VLTKRQQEILELIARTGDNAPAAAAELGVSPRTIKNNLAVVFRTLGVHSLIQAYVKLGWLRVPTCVVVDLDPDVKTALLAYMGLLAPPPRPDPAASRPPGSAETSGIWTQRSPVPRSTQPQQRRSS
jgi:DNA-binding CsgD family transcriptional regulator